MPKTQLELDFIAAHARVRANIEKNAQIAQRRINRYTRMELIEVAEGHRISELERDLARLNASINRFGQALASIGQAAVLATPTREDHTLAH